MLSSEAARRTRTGSRWFVRAVAVLVGLANLVGVVMWFLGGSLRILGGESSSLREALPSVLVAVIAGLLISEIALRAFDSLGWDLSYRYWVVVLFMSIGGVTEGGLLGGLFSWDGTMFPETPPGYYAGDPLLLLGDLGRALLGGGLVGAGFGLVFGFAEGLVLGLPLTKLLEALSD